MNPVIRVAALALSWAAWVAPFVARRVRGSQPPAQIDRRARWGILLQGAAFFTALLHSPRMWQSPLPVWRLAAGIVCAVCASFLSWTAVGRLGKQWRVDAGLNLDHELITSGPYRFVRHPIYTSMLAMLLAAIFFAGTLPGWPIALALFAAGIEIRVHVEDNLLRGRFAERFTTWQRSVPAWLPFIR